MIWVKKQFPLLKQGKMWGWEEFSTSSQSKNKTKQKIKQIITLFRYHLTPENWAIDTFMQIILISWVLKYLPSVQFSSVTQLCPTLCDPVNCGTPGFPVHHQLQGFTQTHVHRVSDAIQPSHPLSSPSPPAPNPSQHQSLFQWVNSSHEVITKYWVEFPVLYIRPLLIICFVSTNVYIC